jgi:hypothetical protein
MGLWLKNEDGFVPVSGGGGGGGNLTWPLLAPDGTRFAPSYSFGTDGSSGMYLADDGSVRIAAEGSDAIGFDDRFITLGGQQQGVGRMSILSGSSGSPVYGFEGDIGTGIYRADSGVIGVSTGGVERLRVGSSSTFTGDLTVDGDIHGGNILLGDDGAKIWGSNSGSNILAMVVAGERRVEVNSTQVILRDDLQVGGQIKGPQGTQTEPTFTSVNDPTSGFYAGNFGGNSSAAISVGGVYRVHVGESKTTIRHELQVDGKINGQSVFGIADGIDTADVLERAETATMPAPDDEGVATADVDSITVNEVVTALLAKVKELSAEIEELKAKDRPLKKQAAPRKKAAKKTTTTKKEDS